MDFADTIYALSSGRLPSGIAVIRIAGSEVRQSLLTLTGFLGAPRVMRRAEFRAADGSLIDKGLAVFFPAPLSFTGTDCGELHFHGGSAVSAAMLSALAVLPGLRHADAGEFTRRAFLNNKLDLVQIEGLADLLAAETEVQRRFALRTAEGHESELYNQWRERLVAIRAEIEAELDFSEEEDAANAAGQLGRKIEELATSMNSYLRQARSAEIVRQGFKVAIIGAPNSGKSTLINALAQREVSIVSGEPGTTRDIIEIALDLKGFSIRLFDTAGIRNNVTGVEAIGIAKATRLAREADLVLAVVDLSCPAPPIQEFEAAVVRVGTKLDLAGSIDHVVDVSVSAQQGVGLAALVERIVDVVQSQISPDTVLLRQRHLDGLNACVVQLAAALRHSDQLELVAEELRTATGHVARLTGDIDPEALLDYIFAEFCIGK